MKRAIFGGSFDPPTKAHYSLAKKLTEFFDEVIVVPAYISPFKTDGSEVDGETRLTLLKRLFEGDDKIKVSSVELDAKGTSYSFMTAQKFFREGDELYFVIGSDGLATLDRWARVDILNSLVTFLVVERPFYPIKQADLDYARTFLRVEVAPFLGEEGSSSLLKASVAFGKEDEVVPPLVADFIKENGLYRNYCEITEKFGEMKLKQSRIEHTYRVVKSAIILAFKKGVSTDKAIKASILHDIAKYLSPSDFEKIGLVYPEEAKSYSAPVAHQITGRAVAKEFFGISDEEILNAIATHTTGDKNMTDLQKIVFCADYIEDGRDFSGIDEIRKITYDDLDKGVVAIIKNTIKYLESKGETVASQTLDALACYEKEKL